jgi:hypothetical protein
MMLELGRLPEKTQSVNMNPFIVLGCHITNSLPGEFPLKMHPVRDGA